MSTPSRRAVDRSPDVESQQGVRLLSSLYYGWRRIAAVTLAVAIAAVLLATVLPKRYSSAFTGQILPRGGVSTPGVIADTSPEDPARQLETQAELVLSDAVVVPTAAKLKIDADDVRSRVSVSTSVSADTLDITAKGASAVEARDLAQAMGDTWVEEETTRAHAEITDAIAGLQTPLQQARTDAASTTTTPEATLGAQERLTDLEGTKAVLEAQDRLFTPPVRALAAAYLPSAPSSLGPVKAGILGLLIGAVVGSGYVLVRTTRRRPLRAVAEIERVVGHPVVAVAPHISDMRVNPGNVLSVSAHPGLLDTARALADAAEASGPGTQGHAVILVTGSGRFAGRSATAVQLAVGLARSAHSVVLVDADTRWVPSGATSTAGLTDALRAALASDGTVTASTQARAVLAHLQPDGAGVAHVAAGTNLAQGPDLLRTRGLAAVLGALRGAYDFVILDGPALEAPESRALMRAADATFLAVSTDDLGQAGLAQSVSLLSGTRVLGVAVVDAGDVVGLGPAGGSQIGQQYGRHPESRLPQVGQRSPHAEQPGRMGRIRPRGMGVDLLAGDQGARSSGE